MVIRVWVTAAAAVMALAGGVVAAPGAQAAAPGCSGASCTGKNPKRMNCPAYSLRGGSVRPGGGGPHVELRVSSVCHAAWARFGGKANESWRFKLDFKQNGKFLSYVTNASPYFAAYTQMVHNSLPYRACIEQDNGDRMVWACTDWF
ncbi:YjfA family protein [Nonomuraea sp. NBC_01738]|uniref:DUF2690 domain-containing protein n=1 Tax=Nonomuraea sp. NBC_01738 TaxID=2976003 RepID=UPI002E12E507|nr:YjfA family protein [Nonomuraea sp. NBC_01738]